MVAILAVSDAVLSTVVPSVFSFMGILVTGLVAIQLAKLNQKATAAAVTSAAAAVEVKAVAAKAEVAAVKAEVVAAKVETVSATLSNQNAATAATLEAQGDKLDGIARVAAVTHDLVNSGSVVQLELYAAATRTIADLTRGRPEGPAASAAAELAERRYREHSEKQRLATDRDAARAEGRAEGLAEGNLPVLPTGQQVKELKDEIVKAPDAIAEKVVAKLKGDAPRPELLALVEEFRNIAHDLPAVRRLADTKRATGPAPDLDDLCYRMRIAADAATVRHICDEVRG